MLNFNSRGLLVPDSNILSSVSELEQEFVVNVYSQERKDLFDQYLQYNTDLKEACQGNKYIQWVDGSFVTLNAPKPKDIDMVSFVDATIIDANPVLFTKLSYPESLSHYKLDAYIVKVYPEVHQRYSYYIGDRLYWMDKFDKTRLNRASNKYPKGFLEINH
jgi:hypothetical protein